MRDCENMLFNVRVASRTISMDLISSANDIRRLHRICDYLGRKKRTILTIAIYQLQLFVSPKSGRPPVCLEHLLPTTSLIFLGMWRDTSERESIIESNRFPPRGKTQRSRSIAQCCRSLKS